MIGLLFVHINEQAPGQLNVRTGIVKAKVGAESYLLEFRGKDYRFSNVFSASQLERFAFFGTEREQNAFIDELRGQMQQPEAVIESAPVLTQ